jgi:ubiquinone/menaquinone biosynthesis C-methylase UbiE
MTDFDARAFDEFEATGWELVAGRYGDLLSPITSQAVKPLLDAAGVRAGMRVLDVGTGPGDAAAAVVARGANATGIDIAAAMVEIATRRHPDATFVQGSATDLPFADESFDAAVGNVVILHVGEPERAAQELIRVLIPGRTGCAVDLGRPRAVAALQCSGRCRRRCGGVASEQCSARTVVLPVRGGRRVP